MSLGSPYADISGYGALTSSDAASLDKHAKNCSDKGAALPTFSGDKKLEASIFKNFTTSIQAWCEFHGFAQLLTAPPELTTFPFPPVNGEAFRLSPPKPPSSVADMELLTDPADNSALTDRERRAIRQEHVRLTTAYEAELLAYQLKYDKVSQFVKHHVNLKILTYVFSQKIVGEARESISGQDTVFDQWKHLKANYALTTVSDRHLHLKDMNNFKVASGVDPAVSMAQFRETIRRMVAAGGLIDHYQVICKLFDALPAEYASYLPTWSTSLAEYVKDNPPFEHNEPAALDPAFTKFSSGISTTFRGTIQQQLTNGTLFLASSDKCVVHGRPTCWKCNKIICGVCQKFHPTELHCPKCSSPHEKGSKCRQARSSTADSGEITLNCMLMSDWLPPLFPPWVIAFSLWLWSFVDLLLHWIYPLGDFLRWLFHLLALCSSRVDLRLPGRSIVLGCREGYRCSYGWKPSSSSSVLPPAVSSDDPLGRACQQVCDFISNWLFVLIGDVTADAVIFSTRSGGSIRLYIDSCCSYHSCGNYSLLTNVLDFQVPPTAQGAGGTIQYPKKGSLSGTIRGKKRATDSLQDCKFSVGEVRFSPSLPDIFLLSSAQLHLAGTGLTLDPAILPADGKVVGHLTNKGGFLFPVKYDGARKCYYLDFTPSN